MWVSLLKECGSFTRPSARDRFGDPQGSKPRLLAKAVHAISRTQSPSCKMDQVSRVMSNLVGLFRGVDPHAVDTSPCLNTPIHPIFWCLLFQSEFRAVDNEARYQADFDQTVDVDRPCIRSPASRGTHIREGRGNRGRYHRDSSNSVGTRR